MIAVATGGLSDAQCGRHFRPGFATHMSTRGRTRRQPGPDKGVPKMTQIEGTVLPRPDLDRGRPVLATRGSLP